MSVKTVAADSLMEKRTLRTFKLYGGGKLQTIMSYVECPNCGMQHKVRKGVVEE